MSFRGRSTSRVLLPFGLDYLDVLLQGQTTEGPKLELPVHGPLAPYEESAAKQSLAVAKLLYDGPFFTGGADSDADPAGDAIQRYSDRYKKPKKVGRVIDEYPYQLEFFPDELYPVMGISKKKKKLLTSTYRADGALARYDAAPEDPAQTMLETLKNLAEDLDADTAPVAEEEEEDEYDDEFEEDDDDDYNAEKYFDGGDDDMGDDGNDEAAF